MRAQVQPEILQQQARLDDPDAAKRREVLRRGKAVFAEMTPEERHRYRLASSPIGAQRMPRGGAAWYRED